MDTVRFRIKKQKNGTILPTITKKQKKYLNLSDSSFEWLPHIIGNSVVIGIAIYSNYSLYVDHNVGFWELFYNGIIYLTLGAVFAYLLTPKLKC